MSPITPRHFQAGLERLTGWADLLDAINVFPVADGDTGRNLVLSLAPLRMLADAPRHTARRLLLGARGNSGNIAARFFSGLLMADSLGALPKSVRQAAADARKAIQRPRSGTMLSVFDTLAASLPAAVQTAPAPDVRQLLDALAQTVLDTPNHLTKLKQAGVVDAGALGIYLFFEGFFSPWLDSTRPIRPPQERFDGYLTVSASFTDPPETAWCIDAVVRLNTRQAEKQLRDSGDSLVLISEDGLAKIHLHTPDPEKWRQTAAALGEVISFSGDDMQRQMAAFTPRRHPTAIHVLTDAAGSVTRADARRLGMTLLDSYICLNNRSLPETRVDAETLYAAMRAGQPVSTAQASDYERHAGYQSVLARWERVLYLCVGSVYTGNYRTVMAWKARHDPDNRLTVIDTGTASGRLGLIATATARLAGDGAPDADTVIRFARRAVDRCDEYVFLDRLKYLAAGGRLSRSRAFFGDTFRVKPVIRPLATGAEKVAAVKNRRAQLDFALERLNALRSNPAGTMVMLEFSDNRQWVAETVRPAIDALLPGAEIILQPLSLTSGAHMGPGTWAVAFLPGADDERKP